MMRLLDWSDRLRCLTMILACRIPVFLIRVVEESLESSRENVHCRLLIANLGVRRPVAALLFRFVIPLDYESLGFVSCVWREFRYDKATPGRRTPGRYTWV